ncbi:hypothetical protein F2P81_003328 [Scophthalmus maximus]|uniref:Uncharacterized protein n=1 Tax=Scophthalmus maximus TaxID=52904 RepID=A0A6A4TKM4_SCOMX|nr:hypothetical protein F2P81_003328 [Scophthalmus maximus]
MDGLLWPGPSFASFFLPDCAERLREGEHLFSPDRQVSALSFSTDTDCTLYDLSFPRRSLHVEECDLSTAQQHEDIDEKHSIDFL